MTAEDRKLLEAVRNWKPPKELHPIAPASFTIYEKAGNSLPPPAMEQLKSLLEAYAEDLGELAMAMEGMIRFMRYVGENLGDKESSEKVAKLLRAYADRFEPFWQRVAEAMKNEGEDVRAAFADMLGGQDEASKTAPMYGEQKPAGTMKLSDIAPPPRPPAWTPKKKD